MTTRHRRRARAVATGLVHARNMVERLESRCLLASTTYTVTNTADSGLGSLREAILSTNATSGAVFIEFNIGSGVHTIAPTSALPVITHPVTINATTQGGYAGFPIIELRGDLAGSCIGLNITGGSSVVRGLIVNRFAFGGIRLGSAGGDVVQNCFIGVNALGSGALGNGVAGVVIESGGNLIGGTTAAERNIITSNHDGVDIVSGTGNTISGNFFGTDVTGLVPEYTTQDNIAVLSDGNTIGGTTPGAGNLICTALGFGVMIYSAANNTVQGNTFGTVFRNGVAVKLENCGAGNLIGGATAAARNLISGSLTEGVLISGGGGAIVQGNYIGTNAAGTAALGNGYEGISIFASSANLISQNLISGNGRAGVRMYGGSTLNHLEGNVIGTNAAGTAALPNTLEGVYIGANCTGNTIGGVTPSQRNLVSGNTSDGVHIGGDNAHGNTVLGNYIGTNATGGLPIPNYIGVHVDGTGSQNNFIGIAAGGGGNVISGNSHAGVVLGGTTIGTRVFNNRIGTTPLGTGAVGNTSEGVLVFCPGNFIGGNGPGEGNVVSSNVTAGVSLQSTASGTLVRGNIIGMDLNASFDLGNNGPGVLVFSSGNTIGGPSFGDRNFISSNAGDGVRFEGASASGNFVYNNYIGTDFFGIFDIGNFGSGVYLLNAPNNTIGGVSTGMNLISGNSEAGVAVSGASSTGNVVQGNRIGTTFAGTAALGNTLDAILLYGSSSNTTIGGTAPGEGNVLSGNLRSGIEMVSSSSNTIRGNLIGTSAAGGVPVPNLDGILLSTSSSNAIGGTTSGSRNVISGNTRDGIVVDGTANTVQGNFIGVALDGSTALGNGRDGIALNSGPATGNFVGGSGAAGNTIAFNSGRGINLYLGSGTTIFGNSIYSNGNLGIDIGNDGVTANDPLDPDGGTNEGQNFPVTGTVNGSAPGTFIKGTLNSTASSTFYIDVYSSPNADPSGYGEGKIYLGFFPVTTNASGDVTFSHTFASATPVGWFITATATDVFGDTSEFSQAVIVPDTTPPTITTAVFIYQTAPHRVVVTFSEDVAASVVPADLVVQNLTTPGFVTPSAVTFGPGNSVSFNFSPTLDDANFRATLPAGSVQDAAGNPLAADFSFDFFFLAGDADHDRDVDATDLGILSANWQGTGRSFPQGDFNYDGNVEIHDLYILTSRWRQTLAPPAAPISINRSPNRKPLRLISVID